MVKKNIIHKFGQSDFMLVSFSNRKRKKMKKKEKSHNFNAIFLIIASTITNYISWSQCFDLNINELNK